MTICGDCLYEIGKGCNCMEEENRKAELPRCDRCEEPTEEDDMAGAICISCETESEINYWRTQ